MKLRKKVIQIVLLFILISGYTNAGAQISFPKGNVLDTVTSNENAYQETLILFHTGIYKSSDYIYEKISDSLDPNWLVTACFNGECRNELEMRGNFLADYGLNDTSCFIAFHVESHGYNGKSTIRYRVINSKDPLDQAILEVNVTYKGSSGYKSDMKKVAGLKYYPNPASQNVNIIAPQPLDLTVTIINMQGETVLNGSFLNTLQATINTSQLSGGMYFLKLQNGDDVSVEKLMIRQ